MRDEHKHATERIARLRSLALELERLPQSRERDRLLRDTRHRTVMLDSGDPGRAPRGRLEVSPVGLFEQLTLTASSRAR